MCTDKLRNLKLLKIVEPGVRIVASNGVITLEGGMNGVLRSLAKIRNAIGGFHTPYDAAQNSRISDQDGHVARTQKSNSDCSRLKNDYVTPLEDDEVDELAALIEWAGSKSKEFYSDERSQCPNMSGHSSVVDEGGNAMDGRKPIVVTSQNVYPSDIDRWKIDKVLWEFIKFSQASEKWENVLKAVDFQDGSGKVELSGNAKDVDRLKKVCIEGRMNRTIVKQMFPVLSGHSAEATMSLVRELGDNKVLVKSTNDGRYLELTGKEKDVHNLVYAMEKLQEEPSSHDGYPTEVNESLSTQRQPSSASTKQRTDSNMVGASCISTATNDNCLVLFTAKSRMKVTVVSGNILSQGCEVIVCPSDQAMDNSGGLARAIVSAAGYGLLRECKYFISSHGHLDIGMVTDTQAGNIPPPTRRVIHTRGPSMDEYRDVNECCRMLEATFWNCLKHANFNLQVSSVALPAISSGALGVPSNVVATAACLALVKFDETMASKPLTERHLKEIKFVNINPDVTRCMVATFRETLTPHIPGENATFLLSKMAAVVECFGLAVIDVPGDGDCALHAIVDQLRRQGNNDYDVRSLRREAVRYIESNKTKFNWDTLQRSYDGGVDDFLKRQKQSGVWCSELMLRSIADVIHYNINIYHDNGHLITLEPSKPTDRFVTIGLISEHHYVSLCSIGDKNTTGRIGYNDASRLTR